MTTETLSPRALASQAIEIHLEREIQYWNAPYGILTSMIKMPNGGYIRCITFGCARSLDASVYIWTAKRVTTETRGPLSYLFTDSVDGMAPEDFIDMLSRIDGSRKRRANENATKAGTAGTRA
jgi:hypothetical protein